MTDKRVLFNNISRRHGLHQLLFHTFGNFIDGEFILLQTERFAALQRNILLLYPFPSYFRVASYMY